MHNEQSIWYHHKAIVTEESMNAMADKKYTFIVARRANKTEIKKAVEKIFGVKVENVNTLTTIGKVKRMGSSCWKKLPTGKKPLLL